MLPAILIKNKLVLTVQQVSGVNVRKPNTHRSERVKQFTKRDAGLFSKSCAPGVRNPEFVTDRVYNDRNYWYYGHLCDLCHGMAAHYCDRYRQRDCLKIGG